MKRGLRRGIKWREIKRRSLKERDLEKANEREGRLSGEGILGGNE